jgi:hypothetical protein
MFGLLARRLLTRAYKDALQQVSEDYITAKGISSCQYAEEQLSLGVCEGKREGILE